MFFDLRLMKINPHMSGARIECVYAQAGQSLKIGDKLFDLSVDLSSAFAQDCPPISYFRVVARERGWVRETCVEAGDSCDVGTLLAILSPEPEDDLEGAPARPVRVTTAGITFHAGMWSASGR
jgi:hypothetical protein